MLPTVSHTRTEHSQIRPPKRQTAAAISRHAKRQMPDPAETSPERERMQREETLAGPHDHDHDHPDSTSQAHSGEPYPDPHSAEPSTGGGSDQESMEILETTETGRLVYGHASVMGRRRVMEDSLTEVAPLGMLAGRYSFFAVYDGHGGAKAAETCSRRLYKCVEKHVEEREEGDEGIEWEKVMVECFGMMDEEIEADWRRGEEGESMMMGSTAAVVLVGADELVVANCGDSRVVLCRDGEPVPLSRDHKPDRPDEKERIEAAGGMIINSNGWRVQGVLATSRSLGHHHLKPYVTSVPEVTVTRRTQSDHFLIIATDGLWGVVSNEAACELVKRCLSSGSTSMENPASVAAVRLAEMAIAKGSNDNISAIIVQLT